MKTIPRKYPECFGLSLNLAVASPQPVSLEITFGPFGPFERHSYSAHGFTWFQDSPCFTQVLVTLCWELGAKYIETRGMNQTCSSTGCMELWVVWSHKPGGSRRTNSICLPDPPDISSDGIKQAGRETDSELKHSCSCSINTAGGCRLRSFNQPRHLCQRRRSGHAEKLTMIAGVPMLSQRFKPVDIQLGKTALMWVRIQGLAIDLWPFLGIFCCKLPAWPAKVPSGG